MTEGNGTAGLTAIDAAVEAFADRGGLLDWSDVTRRFGLEGAVQFYDRLIPRMGAPDDPTTRLFLAQSFYAKGQALNQLNRDRDAVAAYDQAFEMYSELQDSKTRSGAARALYNKAASLGRLDDVDAAMAVCDELVVLFGDAPEAEARREAVLALRATGGYPLRTGHLLKAFRVARRSYRRHSKDPAPEVRALALDPNPVTRLIRNHRPARPGSRT